MNKTRIEWCDWLWNLGGQMAQKFWERVNPIGFDEVYYRMRVVKGDAPEQRPEGYAASGCSAAERQP